MEEGKHKLGAVEVFMPREFFNSLVTALSAFETIGGQNKYSDYALRIKNKIMQHSRYFTYNGDPQLVTYFYVKEAAILIKLLAIYCNVIVKPSADFFSEACSNSHKKKTGNADP